MSFLSLLKNALHKNDIKEEDLTGSIVQIEEKPVEFTSNELVNLALDNVIDTTDPLTIAKYKNNLRLLAEKIKKQGYQDKFKLIRNDDNFPYGFNWELSSKTTQYERVINPLSYQIRKMVAEKQMPPKKQSLEFDLNALLNTDEELRKRIEELDPEIGAIYGPVHFRSTKHFTINTALSHTGSYNAVTTDRNFTIIDDLDNFLNSPYRYSMAYQDAYLDMSHESFPISKNAIILMSKEKYNSLKNNPELMEEIKKRKLVIYSGDEGLAVNMLLTSLGIYPNGVGFRYHEYDPTLNNILDESIIDLAETTRTPYNLGHGNIDGKGGHFTSYFDDLNRDFVNWQYEFIVYLQKKLPEVKVTADIFKSVEGSVELIKQVGLERLESILKEYNKEYLTNFKNEKLKYMEERKGLSNETKELFRSTIKRIKEYFKNTHDYNMAYVDDVNKAIRIFIQSPNLEEQISAAKEINQYLDTLSEDKTRS